MDCKTYIKECCEATLRNPPHRAFEDCNTPEAMLRAVRAFARLDGAGLTRYPLEEVEKHLYLFWDAYIKSMIGKPMKLMGNFSNKKLFAMILEAREDAIKADKKRARRQAHTRTRKASRSEAVALPGILEKI
jgi:hypothetical protein